MITKYSNRSISDDYASNLKQVVEQLLKLVKFLGVEGSWQFSFKCVSQGIWIVV